MPFGGTTEGKETTVEVGATAEARTVAGVGVEEVISRAGSVLRVNMKI